MKIYDEKDSFVMPDGESFGCLIMLPVVAYCWKKVDEAYEQRQ